MKQSFDVSHRDDCRGFTIVEVLVCLFVIGIILAIALPAVQQSREAARAIQCRSNLHNIGIACHSHMATLGYFPAIGKVYPPGQYGFSFLVQLLPYLDQKNLFEKFDLTEIPTSLTNQQVTMEKRVPLWLCPVEANSAPSQSNYLGNFGTGIADDLSPLEDGFLAPPPGARPAEFTRGLSNTVAVSECRSARSSGDGLFASEFHDYKYQRLAGRGPCVPTIRSISLRTRSSDWTALAFTGSGRVEV